MNTGIASSFYSIQKETYQKYNPFYSIPGIREQEEEKASAEEAKRMRTMLKDLLKSTEKEKNHVGYSDQKNIFDELSGASDDDDENNKLKKVSHYNYKEVANKIRQAKTSLGAAQAVIAAKRKVAEVKRRISNGDGDPEELQLDLTHAKRMEMAARKKRHNLELEELVERTRAEDGRLESSKETSGDIKQAVAQMSEEEIAEREDAVFEERQEMLEEAMEMTEGRDAASAEDMLADMNAMIAEYGEELLEELEEQMEQLECMEIVDPHMSEEKLQELKRKHRAAESKAMVKADMDYLKGMIKHMQEKGGGLPGISETSVTSIPSGLIFAASASCDFAAPPADVTEPSVDIAL